MGAPSRSVRNGLDDVDRTLIERLRTDGRASNRSLAVALGVNEATVSSRLRRLEEDRVVRVVAVTDMEALGHEFLAFAKVQVSGRTVGEVGAQLAEMPENIGVVVTVGASDLILSVLARDRHHLSKLLTDAIPAVEGVSRVRCELALDVLLFRSEWATFGSEDRPVEPRGESGQVDSLDLRIIDLLQEDARSSNRRVAAQLGVSEGTVRARIKRLEDDRVIRIQAISDTTAFNLSASAYVGVQVEGGKVDSVASALVGFDEAAAVVRSLGDYDLWVVLMASSREALIDLVLNRIATLPGVKRTETTESCGVIKHSYTWARLVS